MDEWMILTWGLILGAVPAWLLAQNHARVRIAAADARCAEGQRSLEAQRRLLQQDQDRLSHQFKALSADALRASNEAFLKLAEQRLATAQQKAEGDLGQRQQAIQGLVAPLQQALQKYEVQLAAMEDKRQKAYGSLESSLKALGEAQGVLQRETGTLATALRNPQVRGRWGELTLHRVVELAGLTEHCDFVVQTSIEGEQGRLRPDLLVKLPAHRLLVVDAKAPLAGYLEAVAATTEEQRSLALQQYARQLKAHVRALSEKAYWQQFEATPEFVVLFLPGEAFFSAALAAQPELLEEAAQVHVILATPTTLIALLRAVAVGWRQSHMGENAEQISSLGRELHDRLATLTDHFVSLGRHLGRSVEAYNKAVGSYETRVLTAARRFEEYGAGSGSPLPEQEPIVVAPRTLRAIVEEEGSG